MPRVIKRRIARIVAGFLTFGWALAWATTSAVQHSPDLYGLPWLQILVGVAISAWGGMSATLGRWLTARYEDKPWFWQGEVAKDCAVGITVGMGSYFAGATYGLPPMQLGLMLLLAGYLGVKLLSGMADRLMAITSKEKA